MSSLAFAQAPPPSYPLRFLATSLLWGALAGAWLLAGGDALLLSVHAPATIALVHVFTLGLLGNAMLGSLVQFLPVAAASPLPVARGIAPLHATFNLGVMLLLPAIATHSILCGMLAAPLLLGTLALSAGAVLVAVVRGSGARAVRIGIGLAAASLLAALVLGAALLSMRLGWLAPARLLTAAHAGFGLLGWVLGLLAAVGSMVMPMLQGVRCIAPAWLWAWLVLLAGVMLAAAADGLGATLPAAGARTLATLPLLLFAATVIVLQLRAPHRRGTVLRRFWALGGVALGCGALAMWLPGQGVLAGALVVAVGFPALVLGMAMEITGFLAWIELRRRMPRGTRVPGVGSLFDERHKRRVWWLHAAASLSLAVACVLPVLARVSGTLLVLAWLGAAHALWRCWRSASTWQA